MAHSVYAKLREHLHTHPVGFPASESGAEIKLLEFLFSPEQAELASRLDWHHQTLDEIFPAAADLAASKPDLRKRLDSLVQSGGLYHRKTNGISAWAIAPLVVGIWEFNVDRVDAEFKALFDEYKRSPKIDAPRHRGISSQMRVIPIDESVEPERRIGNYDEITALVESAGESIGVMDCICRKSNRMAGHTCEYDMPHQSCTSFSHMAEQLIAQGSAKRITTSEALRMFADFQTRGVVLMPSATKETMFVCSCCKDCCGVLSGLRASENPSENALSNYYATVTDENCIACGECETYCPMDAISTETGVAIVDGVRCIGCGVCTSRCNSDAIWLTTKDTAVDLAEDSDDLYVRLAEMRE